VKVPRGAIGQMVEVIWRDPASSGKRVSVRRAPKGMAALAVWKERGVIDDVTDGIARIVHSLAHDPPGDPEPEDEIMATWVPEALIESITIYDPRRMESPDREPD
jgi:hypothetical protein